MKEYIRLKEEKACRHGKVYNWETATYGKIWYDEDVHDLRSVETEFPAIVLNDTTLSYEPTVNSSTEPVVIPHRIDEFDLKTETASSECDEEEQNIMYFNNLFPFNIIYPDDLKSDKDDDDYEINIKQSSGVKLDDPNITMKEYIRLKEEKACRHGKVYNWETATYGKIWYDEDVHDLRSVETEFPAIVLNDTTLSYEPTVSPLNDNKINFKILFDESDNEDYTVFIPSLTNEYMEKEIALVFLYLAQDLTEKKTTMLVEYFLESNVCCSHASI
ncbi:hypothetical protein Tco_0475209 [Tanacetum coccineum]